MSLDAVFNPKRVAVVGASDQPGKVGAVVWENMKTFDGDVIPVTQSSHTVDRSAAFPSLDKVDGPVDLAVLAVPARATPAIARQAAAKGVGAMVILSAGFAETGLEGASLQTQLGMAADVVRIVGPNCFGVQNTANGLNASIAAGTGADPGGIALITQSGAYGMAIHAMGADENIRFSKVYASGNKMDIRDEEVIDYLRDDDATDVICLFTESVGDGAALARAIRATTPTKPVIVAKTGRSAAGQRSARSHTGSLGTSEKLFSAAMHQAGAVAVGSGLEMLDAARTLSGQPLPAGARAAVITNSGGTGVELVDLLADEGVDVPELSADLQATLSERLPNFASAINPVDMTPVWSRFAEFYPWLIDTLARSGEVDIVIPILLARSAGDRETVTSVRDAVSNLRADAAAVPIFCCWVSPESSRANRTILQSAGIPCFEWPERTARAAGHAVRYASARGRAKESAPLPDPGPQLPAGPMNVEEAAALLSRFEVELVDAVVCDNAEFALTAAAAWEQPVVMKIADETVSHRTEVGGVRLGLDTEAKVFEAYNELSEISPRVIVQPQVSGVEMVIGGINDPTFGPMVMVGTGGTMVELVEDVAFSLAPVDEKEAKHLLQQLKGHKLLTGFRDSTPADVDRLAALLSNVSRLTSTHPEIKEIDLNPVMVDDQRAVSVDWKINVGDRKGASDA